LAQIQVYSTLGTPVAAFNQLRGTTTLACGNWAAGMYVVVGQSSDGQRHYRQVVSIR